MKNPNTLKAAVCVVVPREDGKLLAVSRRHSVTQWGLPGGKVDPDESFEAAAVREFHEEVGLTLPAHLLVPVYAGPCDGDTPYWVTTYFYTGDGCLLPPLTPEAGLLVDWVSPAMLTELRHGPFALYNQEAFKALALLRSPA